MSVKAGESAVGVYVGSELISGTEKKISAVVMIAGYSSTSFDVRGISSVTITPIHFSATTAQGISIYHSTNPNPNYNNPAIPPNSECVLLRNITNTSELNMPVELDVSNYDYILVSHTNYEGGGYSTINVSY